MERPPYEIALMHDHILRLEEELKAKKQECENLREAMHKDICSHYVLGECSQEHHNNCVGRNQCIKDLERECEFSNLKIIQLQETLSQYETDLSTRDCIVETCKAQYKQLKAENKELKKIIKRLDVPKHEVIDMDIALENEKLKEEKQGLIKDWEEKKNLACEIACKNEKLKQTLTEIKLVITEISSIDEEGNVGCCYECSYQENLGEILQKIKECEVLNDR